ncbi:MAG: 16S rRNA (cytosine(967)-C(5))-methyltransferase RsmB [Solirubrobacteraceae bacterium]|nr:MAG: 16S rRNA (cytosine(967)-C(5))-methyltransferase RsmB [Solirubrobacterales bacterium]
MPTPARRVAHAVVGRACDEGAFADRALPAAAARAHLSARDRALATQLTYGTIQRLATLDRLLERLAGRPPSSLTPVARAALRLGLFQLLFLDGIADHAVVHESVELAKPDGRGAAGLVNAVLRRASREGRPWLGGLGDATPGAAALRHSHPSWLAERWFATLGADTARALMAADNQPAETALRANTLRLSGPELRGALDKRGVHSRPAPGFPEAVVVEGAFDARESELARAGALMAQSRGSMLVARTLHAAPGERVLDLCAAPGAKTTHLGAIGHGRLAALVAVERHAGRAQALARTCARLGVAADVRVADARSAGDEADAESYDRVLVDAPCSGLGTLRSHPDARWRIRARDIPGFTLTQRELLTAAARTVRPGGGVLVYSTCTIEPAENDDVVSAFLEAHSDFRARSPDGGLALWNHAHMPGRLQTLPHRDGTDGFFIARLVRA